MNPADAVTVSLHPGIVAGGDILNPQPVGRRQQGGELHRRVAADAGVGGAAGAVVGAEGGDDLPLKQLLGIQDDALDPQLLGGPLGGFHRRGVDLGKTDHRSGDREALLLQDPHGDAGIHAPAHSHQDLVLLLISVKPAAGQNGIVHAQFCLPPCALLWATASRSQRSFSGCPAWPLTQT